MGACTILLTACVILQSSVEKEHKFIHSEVHSEQCELIPVARGFPMTGQKNREGGRFRGYREGGSERGTRREGGSFRGYRREEWSFRGYREGGMYN